MASETSASAKATASNRSVSCLGSICLILSDEADNLGIGIELFVQKGVMPDIHTPMKDEVNTSVQKEVEEYDFDSSPEAYTDPLQDKLEEEFSW